MTMEDVWVETVHQSERRDRKRIESVPVSKDKKPAQDRAKHPVVDKDTTTDYRGQERKRAA